MAEKIVDKAVEDIDLDRLSLNLLAESVTNSLGMHPVVGSIRIAAHTGNDKDFQDASEEFNALTANERRSVASEAESVAKGHVEAAHAEPEEVGDEFFDFFEELERDFEETSQALQVKA